MIRPTQFLDRQNVLHFQAGTSSLPWQGTITNLFKTLNTQARSALHPLISNPGEILVGGMWSFFLAIGVASSIDSLRDLYENLTAESTASERFEKIGIAVKRAFVDVIGLAGTCAYTGHWAHEAQLISLPAYAPILRGLGLGSSLIINTIECGSSIYHIHREKEAILTESSAMEREKHKQRLCLYLMKLIGATTMVAWTALGIAALSWGLAMSPILMSALLGASCISSFAAFFYEWKLENRPELFPIPNWPHAASS